MSETMPRTSGEAPTSTTPETANTESTIDEIADNLDSTLQDGEQSQPSPAESLAKTRLEGLKNFRNTVSENFVTPTLNTIGKKLDTARDIRDSSRKKIFMLDRREAAKNKKIDRLESKLATMDPNSRRHRRAEKKLIKTQRKLFWIERSNNRISGAIGNRQNNRDRVEQSRENKLLIRRELQLVAKRVAAEKRERKAVREKLKSATGEAEKTRLKTEINGWKNIHSFKKDLVDEAMKKYKKTFTKKDDYELAD